MYNMSILWAVLLSLLSLSAAQCSEKKNEENVFEDLSFFQEDESVIQEDNTESDFKFYEGNEEELETNNINFDLAEDMLDEDMPRENDGQIQDYKNKLYEDLTFKCEDGHALRRIKSEYEKKDRRWDFGCTPRTVIAPKNVKCKWHTFSNTVGKRVNFECPDNHFMAGLKSVYITKKKDRQWDAFCCNSLSYCNKNCRKEGYQNGYTKLLDYTTSGTYVITGIYSQKQLFRKDHRWGISICDRGIKIIKRKKQTVCR